MTKILVLLTFYLFIFILLLIGCGTIGDDANTPDEGIYTGELQLIDSIITLDSKFYISYFNNKIYISFIGDSKNNNISVFNIKTTSNKVTGKIIWFHNYKEFLNGNITINYTDNKITGKLILSDNTQFNLDYTKTNDNEYFLIPNYNNITLDGLNNDWNNINSTIHNSNNGNNYGADLKTLGLAQNDTSVFAYIEFYNNPILTDDGIDTSLNISGTTFSVRFLDEDNNTRLSINYVDNTFFILDNAGNLITDNHNIFNVVYSDIIEIEIPKYIIKDAFVINELEQLNLKVITTREDGIHSRVFDSLLLNGNSVFTVNF